jgi:hypothetical protein
MIPYIRPQPNPIHIYAQNELYAEDDGMKLLTLKEDTTGSVQSRSAKTSKHQEYEPELDGLTHI